MIFGHDTIDLPEKFPIQVRRLFEQFNVMMAVSIEEALSSHFLLYRFGNYGSSLVRGLMKTKERTLFCKSTAHG